MGVPWLLFSARQIIVTDAETKRQSWKSMKRSTKHSYNSIPHQDAVNPIWDGKHQNISYNYNADHTTQCCIILSIQNVHCAGLCHTVLYKLTRNRVSRKRDEIIRI